MPSLHGAIFSLASTATFHVSSVPQGTPAHDSARAVRSRQAEFARSPAPRVNPLARALADVAAIACLRERDLRLSGIRSGTGPTKDAEITKD
jgi:hypothetical protein